MTELKNIFISKKIVLKEGDNIIIFHWFLAIIIISYILIKKRYIDFYTVAILSFIMYTLPCFWGTTWTTQNMYFNKIHIETYFVVDSILFFMFIVMTIFDYKLKRKYQANSSKNRFQFPNIVGYFIIFFSYLNLLLAIAKVGISPFLAAKKSALNIEMMNPFVSLAMWSSTIGLTFGGVKKNKKIIFLSILVLLFSLFLGRRSRFIIGIISLFLVLLSRYKRVRLAKMWKYGLWVLIIVGLAILYRRIYPVVKRLNFSRLKLLLTSKEFYFTRVFVLPHEVYNVFSTLNIAVKRKLDLGINFINIQILDFIPFMKEIIGINKIRFSKVIMQEFYPTSKYGMGSNIWAEMYSVGRYFLLYSFIFIWLKAIKRFNLLLINNNRSLVFFIPYGVYVSLYIHRLSFSLVIGDFKYVLFIYVITMMFYIIFIKPYLKKEHSCND